MNMSMLEIAAWGEWFKWREDENKRAMEKSRTKR
jgi:hypothetical protein